MRAIVREAFLAMRGDLSPDAVVADPYLNERFLQECKTRKLLESAVKLNVTLLNLRRASDLKGLKSRRVVVPNQEDFRFASEVAARFLERRDKISLDQILCDPVRAAEFDNIAAGIAPGFTAFQYRWAAFGLRKLKRLRPELLSKVVAAEAVVICKVADLDPELIPTRPGLYIFLQSKEALYVGECENLRKRLGKHLDHSDNKGLAHWLWQHGTTDLHVEYHVLPIDTSTRIRKALEAELIISRKPIFNIAGTERPG
jgi:site-specific DNA-methyltransferase (adenine-specific)